MHLPWSGFLCAVLFGLAGLADSRGAAREPVRASSFYTRDAVWTKTLLKSRAALRAAGFEEARRTLESARIWRQFEDEFPVAWDWILQDYGNDFARWFGADDPGEIERQLEANVLKTIDDPGAPPWRDSEGWRQRAVKPESFPWFDWYAAACEYRRTTRLRTMLARAPRMVFTKHHTVMPSFFAYTEGLSDAQAERHFVPNSALCLLEMNGIYGRERVLINDPTGAIRDPAVSEDARRVLFSWKKSLNEDDYHLYEWDLEAQKVRQLTSGSGFADYEGCYLPNGDLVFVSSRCVQTVDCWWTEVSNLYTCDRDGRFLRRLGFDQVHTLYPSVLDDSRVIYTRWDYNDRGQIFPQGLFQMNPDGTGQTEFYGNNSWFPTTIAHARGIPGSQKVVAIFIGHHTPQAGKLGVLDPARGRQENEGAQLIAPVRPTPAVRIDGYGQEGDLFQYPYPLSETELLVTYAPRGWQRDQGRPMPAHFSVYWMDWAGQRELLVSDAQLPCNQAVPLVPRPRTHARPSTVDYRQTNGTYYVQDVYAGTGLEGVRRGSIQALRVIALEYRAAGVGENYSDGLAGGALVSTPISVGNGSWDVKAVLGSAKVYADGSAFFTVPARTPVYFQALDEKGHAAQTMRSWSTLQPGENQACVGCHESKNSAPPAAPYAKTLALLAGPQTLEPFYGPPRGFSYAQEIQPIWDRHCVACHHDRNLPRPSRRPPSQPRAPELAGGGSKAFSLLGDPVLDPVARRQWSESYLTLTGVYHQEIPDARNALLGDCAGRLVNWISSQSVPSRLPPYSAGAARSGLLTLLESGHGGARLGREEFDKIACWIDLLVPYCGDYVEANAWSEADHGKYRHFLEKRRRMEALERENIASLPGPR